MKPEIKKRIEQIQNGMVPEGYDKTKIGIILREWNENKFINLFGTVTEFTDHTDTYPLYSLTIENGVIPKSERYEREFLIQKAEDTYKIVKENQFVYNPMNLRFGAVARYKGKHPISVSGDLFTFEGGFSASRNELNMNKGICYLHYGDIHKSNKSYIDVKEEYFFLPKLMISVNKLNSNYLLYNGDIVFADASEDYEGTCKYAVVKNKEKIPFIAGLHTIIARPKNDSLSNNFKRHCFSTFNVKRQFAIQANGISVYGISKSSIAKISFLLPSLPEQTAIAEILSTADRAINLYEKQLDELKKQKKALMQLLLTGIVRVNSQEVS